MPHHFLLVVTSMALVYLLWSYILRPILGIALRAFLWLGQPLNSQILNPNPKRMSTQELIAEGRRLNAATAARWSRKAP